MASVHGALSAAELSALAGPATPRWFLSVVNSSLQATALINMPAGITFPVATLTVDTTSANWSSVAVGNTVAIGSAPGLADYGLYRVRQPGTATTLNIGETSSGDLGLSTASIRNTTFGDNSYVTVYLARRDIHSVLPRITAATGEIWEDYSATVGTSHTKPDCIINITFTDTDRRAGFVDTGQTYRTVRFDAAEDLWPVTTSITGRLWTAPASWGAPIAGSTTGPSVTYQVPRSAENYEIKYQATDNLGTVTTCYRQVWAHDYTGSTAPLTISEISNIGWNESGIQLTISLYGQTLASIPTGAMVCVWYDPRTCFNGGDITSCISQFVGWIVRQTEQTEPGLTSVTLEIVGPEGMLARRGAYSQWFDVNPSPTTWQQLPSTLSYVDFIVHWIIWQRARGVVECMNYVRDGHSNLTARTPQWRVESTGNLLSQAKKIAEGYSGSFGCNPDGAFVLKRRINLLDYSLRSALATRCTLNETRYHDMQLNRELTPRCRHVRGEAFTWDGAATLPTPLLSDAPGDAPGQGVDDITLQGQLADNQSFLNTLTGLAYADANNPYGSGQVKISGFWPVFFPAEHQYVALTIPASLRADNAVLALNVSVKSVSLREVDQGTWDTILSVEGETSGVPGKTVLVPSQAVTSTVYNVSAPPVQSTPVGNSSYPTRLLLYGTGGQVYRATNAVLSGGAVTPTWTSLGVVPNTPYAMCADAWKYDDFYFLTNLSVHKVANVWSASPGAPTRVDGALPAGVSNYIYSNIISSINRRGYFAWLGGGAAGWYYCYTDDYFASVKAVLINPTNSGHSMIGLAMNCFATGRIFAGVGWYIWESTDWGLTWGPAIRTAGQDAGLPYNMFAAPGGANDTNDDYAIYAQRQAGPTFPITKIRSGTAVIDLGGFAASTDLTQSFHCPLFNALTIDSNYMHSGSFYADHVDVTSNFWTSATSFVSGAGNIRGINGFPTNPNYLLIWGTGGAVVTFNRGVNCYSLSAPAIAVSVIGDLSEYYTTPYR